MKPYFFPLLVAAALLSAGGQPVAAQPPQDVGAMLGKLRGQVVNAEVYAVAARWVFRRKMSETDLPAIGCLYRFGEPAAVAALMDTLAAAPIVGAATPGAPLDARVGVYLHARDGTTTRLVFERTYREGDARGLYDGTVPFVAKAPFDRQLRALLAPMQPATIHYQCDRDDIPIAPRP
jgi:hypothetical protein